MRTLVNRYRRNLLRLYVYNNTRIPGAAGDYVRLHSKNSVVRCALGTKIPSHRHSSSLAVWQYPATDGTILGSQHPIIPAAESTACDAVVFRNVMMQMYGIQNSREFIQKMMTFSFFAFLSENRPLLLPVYFYRYDGTGRKI